MFNILIVTADINGLTGIQSGLTQKGFACSVVPPDEETTEKITRQAPELVLLDLNDNSSQNIIKELCETTKHQRQPQVIALVNENTISSPNGHLNKVDDFVIMPCSANELAVRAKRLLQAKMRYKYNN